jgi:hypothetical protein
MEVTMFCRTLIALFVAALAATAAVAADTVDCKKVPDHPNCSPRA